jgi:radical SAM protein with 4Fe4S-binding SPASM domain
MYQPPRDGDLEEIKIEVTRDCPLACVHCSSNASSGNTLQLPIETVLSLVTQATEMGVKSIVLSGGEPLVWPWLSEAVSACSEHNLRCSIYSTGIDRNDGAQKIVTLAKQGLHKVVFSLYSPYKEYHEQVTTTADSFDKTVSAIAMTKANDVETEIHFVPLKRNYRHLEELVKFAEENGVSQVSILRFVPHGRGIVFKGSQEMLRQKESLELRNLILKCRQNHSVRIRVGSPYNILLLQGDIDCNAARQTLIIGPNGNLYPCDAFKNIEPSDIGLDDPYNNIMDYPLRWCWENSLYLDAIRRYLSTPFKEPCSTCKHLEWCKSGCLAQKVIEQESILGGNITKKPDPLCLKKLVGGSDASR